ncbi:hypothetical protein PSPO01_05317 [Paraphaeosphaeria sporulosa]
MVCQRSLENDAQALEGPKRSDLSQETRYDHVAYGICFDHGPHQACDELVMVEGGKPSMRRTLELALHEGTKASSVEVWGTVARGGNAPSCAFWQISTTSARTTTSSKTSPPFTLAWVILTHATGIQGFDVHQLGSYTNLAHIKRLSIYNCMDVNGFLNESTCNFPSLGLFSTTAEGTFNDVDYAAVQDFPI